MNYSEYIVFADESGDHGMDKIHENYPIFVLVFCVIKKSDYINQLTPFLQKLKLKYWGHDDIILHERDIRKNMHSEYKIFNNKETRLSFIKDLTDIINITPFHVISSVIRKDKLAKYCLFPNNPYQISVLFCVEQLLSWLILQGEIKKSIHVLFESRGKVEDRELGQAFREICNNASTLAITSKEDFSQIQFNMRFVNKLANSAGLQLADLIARPIGLSALRPEQSNQAFDVIRHKFIKLEYDAHSEQGFKLFPA